MSDEEQIRGLIERWVAAVHAGDLPAVLAHHAPDLVMFDVPPPYDGVRGIQAYRATRPGFFRWQGLGRSVRAAVTERHSRHRRGVRLRAAPVRDESRFRARS
jgi:ketosteroid isomerase-like protein